MTNLQTRTNPLVSIVIPVYADPEGLRRTLQSAVDQQYDPFEIVISVTPSTGETLEVAKEYEKEYSDLVHIVEVDKKGRARARNAGIEGSNGEIIAFVDADIWMKSDWLSTSVSDLKDEGADYLACNVVVSQTTDDSNFVGKYDRALSIPVSHYVDQYQFAPTAALLLTRDLIEEVGAFNPELTSSEDREFGNRVYDQGYELYVSDCEVYHPSRRKISEQIKKAIRIGIGMEELRQQYPERYSLPSLKSPLSYAPPNPFRLRSRLASNDYEPNVVEWVSFYSFNYFLKLNQQRGRWKQYRQHESG